MNRGDALAVIGILFGVPAIIQVLWPMTFRKLVEKREVRQEERSEKRASKRAEKDKEFRNSAYRSASDVTDFVSELTRYGLSFTSLPISWLAAALLHQLVGAEAVPRWRIRLYSFCGGRLKSLASLLLSE